jgi:hypothetical protein
LNIKLYTDEIQDGKSLNKKIVTFIRLIFKTSMVVEAEKLYLIEQLSKLEDVKIIQQIKDLLSAQMDVTVGYKSTGEPITKSELIARAEASNTAIKKGKLTSIEELKEESKNW